jgi:hypothetical protein
MAAVPAAAVASSLDALERGHGICQRRAVGVSVAIVDVSSLLAAIGRFERLQRGIGIDGRLVDRQDERRRGARRDLCAAACGKGLSVAHCCGSGWRSGRLFSQHRCPH